MHADVLFPIVFFAGESIHEVDVIQPAFTVVVRGLSYGLATNSEEFWLAHLTSSHSTVFTKSRFISITMVTTPTSRRPFISLTILTFHSPGFFPASMSPRKTPVRRT